MAALQHHFFSSRPSFNLHSQPNTTLFPFHCSVDLGFGDWPGVGDCAAEFLVFLLVLAAVHVQPTSPQNGLPTVPVILVEDSIVPLNATVKVIPPLPSCSQPNTTLFPFTAPMTLCGPIGPE